MAHRASHDFKEHGRLMPGASIDSDIASSNSFERCHTFKVAFA